MSRRVAAVVVGAVVVALLPLAPASAAGDAITFVGFGAGDYLASNTTHPITADASTNDTALSIELFVDGLSAELQPCTPTGTTCSVAFDYDTSVLTDGTHTASVRLNTDVSNDAVRDGFTFFVGDAPVASITAPASGSRVSTSVDITVRGVTDPQGTDYPESFTLRNGGTTIGTAGPCPGSAKDCSQTITWNLTGVSSGTKALTVLVTTHDGSTDTSGPVSITVGALPTVSITVPTNGSKVLPNGSEVVTITATGNSDAAFGNQQKSFELFIDGSLTPTDTAQCSPNPTPTCSSGGGLTWNASGAAGGSTHSAVVKVTVLGRTATSSSVSFTLADSPVVTVVAPPGGSIKGLATVTVNAQTDRDFSAEKPQSVVVTATNSIDTLTFGPISCDSAPVNGACSFTFPWNVSALTGSYTLTAELTTTNGRTRTSAGVVFGIDNPAPTVTLTAPTTTVLKGRVTVSMTAKVEAPLTGHITSIALFAGGTQLGATKACAVAATCTISGVWDTTLLANGTTGILAITTTSNTGAQKFNSPTTTVTLRNPSPSITWISPKTGAVVSGSAVTIKVGLGTDATQSDLPKSAAIYRNGSSTPFDTYLCKATSHSCIATFTWNASKAAGLSTFVVKVRTTKDRVRFSSSTAPRKLYASTGARITFLPSTTVDNGRRVTVTGRMVAARTGLGVANAKVVLVRDPAIGSTLTTTVRTNSTGRFTLTYTARSNTTVTARSVSLRTASGKIWMPAGTGVARQQVRAPMTCSAANRTLGPGQKGQGSCSVPGLPFGTPLFLRYLFGGKWKTLASGPSTSTRIPFFYQFPAKGSYQLRVILSGNKAYAGTNSALMPVTVR